MPVAATARATTPASTARAVLVLVDCAIRTLLQRWCFPGHRGRAPIPAPRGRCGPRVARRPRRAPPPVRTVRAAGPRECRPRNFPAPGQQSQDHTELVVYAPTGLSHFGGFAGVRGGGDHVRGDGLSRSVVDIRDPGPYQDPPNAANVLASRSAHRAPRSPPRMAAMDRTVTGTR